MHRHHALTQEPMTPEQLATWIRNNSKEHFTHTTRNFFTPEEKSELQERATNNHREIIKLKDAKKLIDDAFVRGNGSEYEVTIPYTVGIKKLEEDRDRITREVEKGYSEEDKTVYCIPNEDGRMYHFDIEGNLIDERTRPLSQREIRDYFGELFMASRLKAANE